MEGVVRFLSQTNLILLFGPRITVWWKNRPASLELLHVHVY